MHGVTRRTTCRTCRSTDLSSALPLTPTPVGDAYLRTLPPAKPEPLFPVEVFLCGRCGLAQLLDVVDPEILYGEFTYRTSVSPGLTQHFKEYCETVCNRYSPEPESLVFDIGSNDGTLLNFFREKGFRVLGLDPAKDPVSDAQAKGIETLVEFFTPESAQRIRAQYGPASVVMSNNTFANIDDLPSFVEGFKTVLAPDGVVIIETGYALTLLANGLFDNVYHEHLTYFSLRNLTDFLDTQGLEVFDAEAIEPKGGSIRVIAQHKGARRPKNPRIAELMRQEEAAKVHDRDSFLTLAQKLDRARNAVHDFLKDHEGARVAGFGASVGVTTFLYHFGLGETFEFLIDDNVKKHGTFSPGFHIPVVSSAEGFSRNPDFVLILSWRYASSIVARHRQHAEPGTTFVSIYPEVKIL